MTNAYSARGLSQVEVTQRRSEDGYNELPSAKRRNVLAIVAEVLREPMLLLLIAAGGVYLLIGDRTEALMLMVAVIFVLAITLYQEVKTERVLEALKDLTSPRALVMRDGVAQRIAGREVVRGDMLVLKEGDRVAADALLREAVHLRVDESLLSGEAVPVTKCANADRVDRVANVAPGGDSLPFVYSGTLVVQGHGLAEVVAIGVHSEVGKIGKALHTLTRETSPLQNQTRQLVRTLGIIGISLSLLVVVLYALTRGGWLQGVLAGITLAISILPEEYPVVLIVFLALGAWRMSRLNVLTRSMPVLETLGEASVLCVDKTGTLTWNRMSVAAVDAEGEIHGVSQADGALPEKTHELVRLAILASEVDPSDPMEKAFHALNQSLPAAAQVDASHTLVQRYPLQPALLAITHGWRRNDQDHFVVATKGAFEAIAELCRLNDDERRALQARVDVLSARGLRVLAVAGAQHSDDIWPSDPRAFDFKIAGLVGLADPVRPGVPAALRECYAAGVRTIMITGDYPGTAQAIAREIGLRDPEKIVSGAELQRLSDADLRTRTREANIFARVLPEQKLRIVNALKAEGLIVAMTGDGVNDAPALKAAHIGLAMGGRGTDVAREAASLVILDDDFTSIVAAIRQGRRIYANLKKAMSYLLAVHVPIAGMAVLPLLFGWPLFFAPIHIVFMEFIIDPACAIAFEAERGGDELMRQPPRDPRAPLFDRTTLWTVFIQGTGALLIAFASYGGMLHLGANESQARAFAFATLIFGNLGLIFSSRARTGLLLASLREPNPPLWWVVAGALIALLCALYAPFLQRVFGFGQLSPAALASSVALGMATLLWFELAKLAQGRRARLNRLR